MGGEKVQRTAVKGENFGLVVSPRMGAQESWRPLSLISVAFLAAEGSRSEFLSNARIRLAPAPTPAEEWAVKPATSESMSLLSHGVFVEAILMRCYICTSASRCVSLL